jgi:hypothetical protein
MVSRAESSAVAGYRRVTWEQLVAILREIEGIPPRAVHAMAQVVWRSVPSHPQARTLWTRASRALEPLLTWLRVAEGSPADDHRVVAVGQLAVLASEVEGLGYAALVVLGVDALRAEGLPLRSSRRSMQRGAFEIMADVLYWVWRKPDPRARDLRRTAGSLGSVYWKAKKARGAEWLFERATLESAPIERGASRRTFVWIPSRPLPSRGRNS